MDIGLTPKHLRDIITGRVTFRKCPSCDNDGFEYWDIDGICVLPYHHSAWGDEYEKGACECCNGVGFIENTS